MLTLAKLNQRRYRLLQVQSQLLANGSDQELFTFWLCAAKKKKKSSKLIPCRSVCKCGQLAGSQPWRRLFSGKRPKISNHTVFNHHFIYISSLRRVKRGTRGLNFKKWVSAHITPQFYFFFFTFSCPMCARLLIDKVILICSRQQNRSLSLPRAHPRGAFVKTANSSDNIIMIMVIRLILLIMTRALWAPISV